MDSSKKACEREKTLSPPAAFKKEKTFPWFYIDSTNMDAPYSIFARTIGKEALILASSSPAEAYFSL